MHADLVGAVLDVGVSGVHVGQHRLQRVSVIRLSCERVNRNSRHQLVGAKGSL